MQTIFVNLEWMNKSFKQIPAVTDLEGFMEQTLARFYFSKIKNSLAAFGTTRKEENHWCQAKKPPTANNNKIPIDLHKSFTNDI